MTRRQLLMGTAAAAAPLRARAAETDWPRTASEAIGYLRDYIRINTSNPPGDVTQAAAFLGGLLEKEGIPTRRIAAPAPGKVNLLARLKGNGSRRPLLLLNHTDTVPADRSRWQTDPWGAEIRLNRLWGRGVVDMKSTGMLHLMAMLLLKRRGVPLGRDVVFAATADEEVGGDLGVGLLLKQHPAEVEAEYVLEEGGFSANRLFTESGDVYGVSVAMKQVLWLRLTLAGTGGHGSQPAPNDANAIAGMAAALRRIAEATPPQRTDPVLDQMLTRLGTLANNRFAGAIGRNSIALTSFEAGVGHPPKENVVPSLATATIDCRLLPSQPVEEFVRWVGQTAAEPKLKVEIVHHQPSAPPSLTSTALFRLIETTVKRHAPQAVVTPYLTPFGTDGNWFRRPDRQVYGFFPVVLSAEEVLSMHSDAERMPVAPYEKGLRIFYEVVEGIASAA
ncbi:MAG TPA: M20/M25/M40 family metallo-hydrolase [Bryobacterales bacterium]|nr:M20/M25/M40 family metallo-hydrolase [Bryobacterales bacterium]